VSPAKVVKFYNVLAAPLCEKKGRQLEAAAPERFRFFPSKWEKFPDSGTDKIELGGFTPNNHIRGSHVLFLADFHSNDAVLSQVNALVTLCEAFISSLTIALPYYPHGTMERVEREGEVATASTVARILSTLPSCGYPTRVMLYDLHTLQNRYYFHSNAAASLHSTVPMLLKALKADPPASATSGKVTAVAFPDDGAAKRFGKMFAQEGYPVIICGKVRDGDKRIVRIMEGACAGHHVLIVDDLTRSGGTLYECGKVLKETGAIGISAFVAHVAMPPAATKKFFRSGEGGPGSYAIFDRFYTTDSNPVVADKLPKDDVFRVLDLVPQLMEDLD
jgi:phosphoribosylpyrophosphate synthetase